MILGTLTSGDWIAIGSICVALMLTLLGFLGRIIYKWGTMDKEIQGLDNGIKNIDKKFDRLDEKFDKYILQPLASSRSPLTLTDTGQAIFNRPKIQEFVKAKTNEVIEQMKKTPFGSAYQAQEKLFEVVDSYKTGDYKINLENEAFEAGQHIDILMKVIAIGIRDEVFSALLLSVEDIDKTEPKKDQ